MQREVRWARATSVLWRSVLDDIVLLAPGADQPFVLSGGRALWELLADPFSPQELADRLAGTGGDVPPTIRTQLDPLLADLADRGVISSFQAS